LTAAGAVRYKNVRAVRSCAAKILKTTTSSQRRKRRRRWAFFFATFGGKVDNTMKNFRVFTGLIVALIFVVTAQTAMAQSTIFNIPTTDTVAKGKAYAEFDFLLQAPGPDTGYRTFFYNPRLVVGLPGNAEVGVNFPIFHVGSNSAYIEPNFKWRFFSNDDKGVAVAAGAALHTALNNRDGQHSWGLVYGNVSKKVKSGNYGPRFHAGPYGVTVKQENFSGPRAGVILGYEQPVHSRVSIVADWYSGKNYYGYFTPGVSFSLPGSGLLNVGYGVGNDSWANSNATKNRYFFAYYGVTF
jgi:hypothetical protein